MKDSNNFSKLTEILVGYVQIPEVIKHKKHILQARLCDPTISAFKGYSVFANKEKEIDYLEHKFQVIRSVLKSLSEEDRQLCKMISEQRNIFVMSGILHLDIRTIYRKVNVIYKLFKNKLKIKGEEDERENDSVRESC